MKSDLKAAKPDLLKKNKIKIRMKICETSNMLLLKDNQRLKALSFLLSLLFLF